MALRARYAGGLRPPLIPARGSGLSQPRSSTDKSGPIGPGSSVEDLGEPSPRRCDAVTAKRPKRSGGPAKPVDGGVSMWPRRGSGDLCESAGQDWGEARAAPFFPSPRDFAGERQGEGRGEFPRRRRLMRTSMRPARDNFFLINGIRASLFFGEIQEPGEPRRERQGSPPAMNAAVQPPSSPVARASARDRDWAGSHSRARSGGRSCGRSRASARTASAGRRELAKRRGRP